jgi:Right handed beta helix region
MALAGKAKHWSTVALLGGVAMLLLLMPACGGKQASPGRTIRPGVGEASPGRAIGPGVGEAPEASCDRVASPSGSDGNAGTVASPWRTPQYMADHLAPGQTGCFRAGTFDFNDQTDVTRNDITLTSYPGERATLKGRLWVFSDRVTVSHLNLDQRSSVNSGPRVNGTDDVFDDDDITNYHTEICFILGDPTNGPAVRTVIENSRIHDCGKLPAQNGDHGIYVAHADDTIIRNNWIYDNADRGIQLYPDSQGAQVYGNVIDGNGEGVIFSGNGETASSDNVVHGNVISNSRVRWNVESLWPGGLVGSGNVVRDNCLFASNSSSFYNRGGGVIVPSDGEPSGFASSGNRITDPRFVDRAAGDLRLRASSPCASLQRR